ncbi:DUF5977 domain-containing protein [Chryseobacterium sp. S0630]|uniref:DUF5977 domain-containing protein n=1 Tax=Chryseobacterium sp. S0630 TaxID=2957803 RepID=UPI00209D1EBC|nr:DUF5977 domain-containing protein [Chryseobacterium sp. S0630]MCP1299800.1 DUF5977 domain-containing protein [Chryseobacterium sp. S0630]
MKKIIILIFSQAIILAQAQSQVNSKSIMQNAVNNTAVQSPNAAALFRYSEIPVSLYTGVPDISIPIYTIKEGDIEVPISISYHAGGIKVNDEASSVGLGWNLNAGGRVSQVIAGYNDFNMYGYYNIYPKNASGYVGSIQGCPTPSWNNSTAVSTFYTNDFFDSNSNMGIYLGMDFQPDLFMINLPNKSHKAYLDMAKTTKTAYPKFAIAEQSNINFKLIPVGTIPTYVPGSYGNYDFEVIDEKGILYNFDGAKEVSIPLMGTYGAITGISKYLTKIQDPAGRKVNFYYSPILHSDRLSGCRNTRGAIHYSSNFPGTISEIKENGLTHCSKQSIDENFIEKIEFTNGKVEFYWTEREDVNNSRKLSSIKVYNNYKLIKQYDFNYDYFIATDNLNTSSLVTWLNANPLSNWSGATSKIFSHRLKLLSVTESVTNEKYKFYYNSTYNLPNKLSFSSDFWGYYNGQNNSDTFIPDPNKYLKGQSIFNITSFNNDQTGYWYNETNAPPGSNTFDSSQTYVNFSSDGKHYLSDRRASLASLAGILTSICYPTGGKTEFEYEPNTFSNFPLQSLLDNTNTAIPLDYSFGGGVRIKSIKSTEKVGSNPIIKNYIYDEISNDGTKIISNGNVAELPRFYEIENRCYRKHDVLVATMGQVQDVFTEFYSAPACSFWNEIFKLSVYEGSSSQGMSTLPQGNHVGYSKVIEQITGKGKTETYFTNFYNQTCLSMKARGSYQSIGNGDIIKQRYFNETNGLIKELIYSYKFNYTDNLNTYFIPGAILEPVTSFISKPLVSIYGNNTMYNGDARIQEPIPGLIHNYSINLWKSLLESTTTKEYYPAGSNNFVETKTLTTYNNKYQPNIQKTIYPDLSFNETTYNYAQEKGNQLLLSKNMVDIPLETIVRQTSNGITKTLLKTETGYPTSLPDPQTDNFILPKSVKSYDFSNNSSTNNSFIEVTLDKYDTKGNLIQYTTKEGSPVSIIWGYNSSLPIAKIEGAQYNDIAMYVNDIIATSDYDALNPAKEEALLSAEDNLRKNVNLINYQITTYTYDPLIGVTSVTPSSGIREYYKYDTTNRLEKIVDANNKIVKEFKYRYGTTNSIIYSNTVQSKTFTRTNCGGNFTGSSYIYTVPAGSYSSDVSQLAADQKALDDINTNGQNIANQNGTCTPVVSCSFMFSSIMGTLQFSYNSTTILNSTVNFNISFSAYGIWQNWANGVNIGKVGSACAPSANRIINFNESNRSWKIFIDTQGNCTATLISGNVDGSSGTPLNFIFQYQK